MPINPKQFNHWLNQLPNQLTLLRVGAIPLLLIFYQFEFEFLDTLCGFIFLSAAITDFLDGYFARKYDMQSRIGALIDPIADKMLVVSSIILLSARGVMYDWVGVLFICRELLVSAIRLMALKRGKDIEVSFFGKVKTVMQDTFIFCLFINRPMFDLPFRPVGMISMWLALGISLYSGWLYIEEYIQLEKKS